MIYMGIWSKSSKCEIFCFETKTSFKKQVFWSKNICPTLPNLIVGGYNSKFLKKKTPISIY